MTRPIDKRRRKVLRSGAALATAGVAAGLGFPALAQAPRKLKIGYVYPATGPLAPFGEANKFVIDAIQQTLKSGLTIGGRKYDVEIITKDSQSSANRAGETAADLILKDKIDLMVAGNTPETANPVSDQCELNEVPCVATLCPWQPWFFGRKGDPAKGFNWTYLFFWGLEDVIAVFTNLWKSVPTDKVVGGLFPNDADGNAWGDPQRGFPPALAKDGFKLVDPGRFQNLTADFSAQIAAFKKDNAEIVTGVLIPPDIKTFLTQARQQGFRPKVVTVGKALLFPASVEALGALGDGMTTEVWWTPTVPYKSSLTGQSARQLADAYEASTKKQWTQPIGFVHALFEVAIDTFKRTKDLGAKASIRDAMVATNLDTIVGHVEWGKGPVKNVTKTPLAGGQWVPGKKYKYELVVVDNQTAPNVPVAGKLKLIG
ncbi:MAG TPA: ABC transporter substrate-binding protein [Burkholderiales bacterium]|nr:ABC transporter substrate-binding protein [Burkholderiales bacterium]